MDSMTLFLLVILGFSAVGVVQLWIAKRRASEEDRVMRGYFLKGLAGLMAKVAQADGHVTGNETEMAGRFFGRMALKDDERASCIGYFVAARNDELTVRDHVRRFIAYANPAASEFLYDMLWRLSRIDGTVDPAEDALLEKIAEYLGLGHAIYENFKAGKKPKHSCAELKAAGVPPSLLALAH